MEKFQNENLKDSWEFHQKNKKETFDLDYEIVENKCKKLLSFFE